MTLKTLKHKITFKTICLFPVAIVLWLFVANNYKKRRQHRLPDKWYYGESLLLMCGYWYDVLSAAKNDKKYIKNAA